MVISGWTIYAHPLFLDQLEALIAEVESLRAKAPRGDGSKTDAYRVFQVRAGQRPSARGLGRAPAGIRAGPRALAVTQPSDPLN